MNETIKAIIHTHLEEKTGYEIVVRCIDNQTSRNTLVKKQFVISNGKRTFSKHRGLNIDDLLIVKKNWNKIIGAMAK